MTALKTRRQVLEDALAREDKLHTLSLSRYRLHQAVTEAIEEFGFGDMLEAGAGLSPYASSMDRVGASVTRLDIENRSGYVDVLGDVQSMPAIPAQSIDTVVCTQVLEHVPDPRLAFREFARVLRPRGRLIVTVPHLSMIHEAPHDYFRFTEFALRRICDEVGLIATRIAPTGGLISFLLHAVSAALLTGVGWVPLIGSVARLVNYVVFVRMADVLDRLIGFPGLFPRDYLLIATKAEGTNV